MAKEIYIHIGYPKTATTTLQNYLFPNHPELMYLRSKDENLSFIGDVFFARENSFRRSIDSHKKELLKKTEKSKLIKFVYSEESLTSFSMFFRFEPRPYVWTVEPNSIARKLHIAFSQTGVFDTVKVLVTIRRQDEMLKSMYAQVYNFVFKKFRITNNFIKFLNYSLFENEKGFIIDSLFYNDVVLEYEKLFGKENICVLVFEELKENGKKYINKLSDFMGVDSEASLNLIENKHANIRSSDSGYKSDERNLIEILSYYKNNFFGNVSFGLSNSKTFKLLRNIYIPGKTLNDLTIDNDSEIKLKELYSKSNKILSERYNLDLKKYGYYCK